MNEPPRECWASIPCHPGYEASDQGRVRSVDRVVPHARWGTARYRGVVLRPNTNKHGRRYVVLPARQTRLVAQLVLEAFVGPRPPGMEGCHENGRSTDDRLVNLRWDTPSANRYDSVAHGTNPQAAKERCPRGHLLVEPNLVPSKAKRGQRNCLACVRALSAQRYHGDIDVQIFADREYALIMAGKVAGWQSPTCGKGHPKTPENRIKRKGRPDECRPCAQDAKRRRKAAA